MCSRKVVTYIIFSALLLKVSAQDTFYGSISGMYFMYNPAYSGVAGNGSLRLSTFSFLPGSGYSLTSFYASYDDYFELLHGGAGLWISDDILGEVMNDMRSGFSYSYHLKASGNLYFNAGLYASVAHIGVNNSAVILPDDLDPITGVTGFSSEMISEGGNTLFDLGTGINFSTGEWHGGISIMHLTQPYLSGNQHNYNRLKRLYILNAGTVIETTSDMTVSPEAFIMIQGKEMIAYIGALLSCKGVLFGLAGWHIQSGYSSLEPSIGWKSGVTTVCLAYNYNISGNGPQGNSTTLVKASLKISFNNVEKRRVIHVIKLPEM